MANDRHSGVQARPTGNPRADAALAEWGVAKHPEDALWVMPDGQPLNGRARGNTGELPTHVSMIHHVDPEESTEGWMYREPQLHNKIARGFGTDAGNAVRFYANNETGCCEASIHGKPTDAQVRYFTNAAKGVPGISHLNVDVHHPETGQYLETYSARPGTDYAKEAGKVMRHAAAHYDRPDGLEVKDGVRKAVQISLIKARRAPESQFAFDFNAPEEVSRPAYPFEPQEEEQSVIPPFQEFVRNHRYMPDEDGIGGTVYGVGIHSGTKVPVSQNGTMAALREAHQKLGGDGGTPAGAEPKYKTGLSRNADVAAKRRAEHAMDRLTNRDKTARAMADLKKSRGPFTNMRVPEMGKPGYRMWAKLVSKVENDGEGGYKFRGKWVEPGANADMPIGGLLLVVGHERTNRAEGCVARLYRVNEQGMSLLEDAKGATWDEVMTAVAGRLLRAKDLEKAFPVLDLVKAKRRGAGRSTGQLGMQFGPPEAPKAPSGIPSAGMAPTAPKTAAPSLQPPRAGVTEGFHSGLFDEQKHPRAPKHSTDPKYAGGRFVPKNEIPASAGPQAPPRSRDDMLGGLFGMAASGRVPKEEATPQAEAPKPHPEPKPGPKPPAKEQPPSHAPTKDEQEYYQTSVRPNMRGPDSDDDAYDRAQAVQHARDEAADGAAERDKEERDGQPQESAAQAEIPRQTPSAPERPGEQAGRGPEGGGERGLPHDGSTGEDDPGRKARFEAQVREVGPHLVTARAELTPHIDVSGLDPSLAQHLKLHQQEGVVAAINALDTHGGFILGDGTGAGKTRQILAIADTYADAGHKVLVVAPAGVLKMDWKKGTVSGSFAHDGEAMGIDFTLTKDGPLERGKIALTTYENLGKMKDEVTEGTVLIFDECHMLKNAFKEGSARGLAAMEMVENAGKSGRVVYSSATPLDDLAQISYMLPVLVGKGESVEDMMSGLGMKKYHKGDQVRWRVDAKLGKERVKELLSDLFDKMTADGRMIKRELSMDGIDVEFLGVQLPEEVHDHLEDIWWFIGEDEEPFGMKKANALSHMRRQQESYKTDLAVEWAKRELAAGRSCVIFAHRVHESEVARNEYHIVSDGMGGYNVDVERVPMLWDDGTPVATDGTTKVLKEKLAALGINDVAEIHGDVSKGDVLKGMDAFQKNEARVMIATIDSGGTGINLDDVTGDHPRSMLIITPPFDAMGNVQALGRIWRSTTRSMPRFAYLFTDTYTDAWNRDIIGSKMVQLGATVKGDIGRLDIKDPDLYSEEDVAFEPKQERARRKPPIQLQQMPDGNVSFVVNRRTRRNDVGWVFAQILKQEGWTFHDAMERTPEQRKKGTGVKSMVAVGPLTPKAQQQIDAWNAAALKAEADEIQAKREKDEEKAKLAGLPKWGNGRVVSIDDRPGQTWWHVHVSGKADADLRYAMYQAGFRHSYNSRKDQSEFYTNERHRRSVRAVMAALRAGKLPDLNRINMGDYDVDEMSKTAVVTLDLIKAYPRPVVGV